MFIPLHNMQNERRLSSPILQDIAKEGQPSQSPVQDKADRQTDCENFSQTRPVKDVIMQPDILPV